MAIETHYPLRNGPACGKYPPPTLANAYTPDEPTCPKCLDYITKVRAASPGATAPPPPKPKTSTKGDT